jgi:peptide chain release factor 1
MLHKLDELEDKFERLTASLSDPATTADSARFTKIAKERAGLEPMIEVYREYKRVETELQGNEELLREKDEDLRAMAKEELARLRPLKDELDAKLQLLLLPKDPNDDRNVILEIRQGTGGDEAGLFAQEVMAMYLRFADKRGWKAEIVDESESGAGGIKDVTITISGDKVYSALKYEAGTHRVQRVPATEAMGRIHTSTITVAVMPEAEEVDVELKDADILFEKFRSTGAGGQSVNTTDSAVRLTHKPTGVVVKCQQEKSQTKNRAQAMRMLRAKLFEMELERVNSARDATRKSQVGSGDRSEKIRTYNFPQDRLTDHRIGVTRHNLPAVMAGDIDDMVNACRTYFQAEALKRENEAQGGTRG